MRQEELNQKLQRGLTLNMANLSGEVLREIEDGLGKNHIGGAVIIKKSEVDGRNQKLVDGINDYLREQGYDTTTREDHGEHHIVYVLNPF